MPTIDLSECAACCQSGSSQSGECRCDPEPDCVMASIVSDDCCFNADVLLTGSPGSWSAEFNFSCGGNWLDPWIVSVVWWPEQGKYTLVLDAAPCTLVKLACPTDCDPFLVEFEFVVPADFGECPCAGQTIRVTITEVACP